MNKPLAHIITVAWDHWRPPYSPVHNVCLSWYPNTSQRVLQTQLSSSRWRGTSCWCTYQANRCSVLGRTHPCSYWLSNVLQAGGGIHWGSCQSTDVLCVEEESTMLSLAHQGPLARERNCWGSHQAIDVLQVVEGIANSPVDCEHLGKLQPRLPLDAEEFWVQGRAYFFFSAIFFSKIHCYYCVHASTTTPLHWVMLTRNLDGRERFTPPRSLILETTCKQYNLPSDLFTSNHNHMIMIFFDIMELFPVIMKSNDGDRWTKNIHIYLVSQTFKTHCVTWFSVC